MEKKLEPDFPRIQADSQQLEQVLVNLYLNAIDAMPEGGKLTVEAKIAQLKWHRAHGHNNRGRYRLRH
jgi:signal transduction histidine kinase